MCILSYIYGSYSLELGEDIELFCVMQDFCLVTVNGTSNTKDMKFNSIRQWNHVMMSNTGSSSHHEQSFSTEVKLDCNQSK